MEKFTPKLDWGNELLTSLVWIAKGWAIAAAISLVVLVLLARYTSWGRQFWRVTGDYFRGPDSVVVWLQLAALLLLVIAGVRLSVLLTYQSNDMFNSFQAVAAGLGNPDRTVLDSGIRGFWFSLGIFAILATVHIIRLLVDMYLLQRFNLRWRTWLTDRLTGDWLDDRAYYRARFIDDTIDNPDQRIQADIDIFTAGFGPVPNLPYYGTGTHLLFGAISSVASVSAFTAILWELSGTLSIVGFDVPRALFWIGIAYVVLASAIAFWIGRPIIGLSFLNERYNAAFRYALVRLRDASEAVAFYRGELAERAGLRRLFAPIVTNYRRYVNRSLRFNGWNWSMSQLIVPLPYLLQFPRFADGQIPLGDMSQSASAFGAIQDGLSFFRNAYDLFAGYRAAIIRLDGLVTANREGRALPTLEVADSADDTVTLEDVEVRTPTGRQLVEPIDLQLHPGESLIVVGASGSGKTTLLRSLAELWPYTSGRLSYPADRNETMFLSQLPYVPLGDLRTVVSYPNESGTIPDAELQEAMEEVALPHLVDRLDEVQDWAKVLSPGEQQRVAFARILLTRPKAVFLDESTSALDEGMELTLYRLVRSALPETILVSVSHRSTLEQHHSRELKLLGDGRWELAAIAASGRG
ncbi:ABC transporter ATP-binding protein/permease [Mycobacterium sp. MYCO198283]|uniref:ABC transporter ATP-binding protein/permease n=1 Tax=Mycobacterium sp. MYCO198283 TaxID=2883505 RepID=UPI001E56905F|nr:ABC transporter ATP-binding protein/permease [Mycobacterium sp. MYCO198283]MCG5433179.1 ABC transporter ATP-binding protein/permease [Mycobacterium sp. MYCO198283]